MLISFLMLHNEYNRREKNNENEVLSIYLEKK